MNTEQAILSALAGAFGGGGAYAMNVAIIQTMEAISRHRRRVAFERAMQDPVLKARYEEGLRALHEFAQRVDGVVEHVDGGGVHVKSRLDR